jgi:hypothetical protein
MIDPIDTLAFAMNAPKGSYALLLASGLSRAAQIPTGWDVVLDLVEQLARIKGADYKGDPENWYRAEFGEKPSYSKLLQALSLDSRTARQQLLKGYFQPTPEEAEENIKTPTKAHQAIARLVKSGYVRVIITTNFDRLMEKALDAESIEYTTVSTPSQISGMMPLQYHNCLVFKVNGDYLETTIKNTEEELSHYDDVTNSLLDRIFDEYGLIVCGWSADYDIALREALERCPTRRFTTYWAQRGSLTDAAKKLIDLRRAQVIPIRSADSFFVQLEDKVSALEEFNKSHPLSAQMAVNSLRKNIQNSRLIDLETLVIHEVDKVCNELTEDNFPIDKLPSFESNPAEYYQHRLKGYESLTETLRALMSSGCYYSNDGDTRLWVRSLELVSGRVAMPGGRFYQALNNLKLYPALLLLYAGGIGAVAAGKFKTLADLLTEVKIKRQDGFVNYDDLVVALNYDTVVGTAKRYFAEGEPAPISDHLHTVLRDSTRYYLPQEPEHTKFFDLFEYLLALQTAHEFEKIYQNEAYGLAFGSFRFLRRYMYAISDATRHPLSRQIETEIATAGEAWPLLQAGLFDGSLARIKVVKEGFDRTMSKY